MQRGFKKLLIFLVATRFLIFFLPWLVTNTLLSNGPGVGFFQFTQTSWNRWDAPHYLYLAQNWYTNVGDAANFIVFFPFYPLILRGVIFLLGSPALSGILASTAFFLTGAYFFFKLVQIDYDERVAWWATFAMTIFPTSYFFNAPYTESLFFLLFSLSLYLARQKNWILAGMLSGLSVLSRPYGFLITIAVMLEWFLTKKRSWKYLPIIIFPTLLAGFYYLILNQNIYGSAFEFQKILADHWQKRFVFPFLGIRNSWRIAIGGNLTTFVLLVGWAEAVSTTISWVIIPLAFKYLRRSWAIYYTMSIILFSSTGFVLSTPRYLLSVPPLFVLIALGYKNRIFRVVWSIVSIVLLFCLATLFTKGQWAF